MKIAIASKNPIKIRATEIVMKKIYDDFEIIPIQIESNVSHTPLTDGECLEGAMHRAKEAIKKTNADLGIGMEGGIAKRVSKHFLVGWCAVVDKNGDVAVGHGGGIEVPEIIVKKILEGKELGDVMDEITGIDSTKRKIGASGILTRGLINRQKAWEEILIHAMAKKLSPELYR